MPNEIVMRVDATCPPIVAPGDKIQSGQKICAEPEEVICPISGTVRTIHFDPERHEFLILVVRD